MELGLAGKRALVTASSQGLGKAIAKQLLEEGCDVMLSSRHLESLKRAADELGKVRPTGRVYVHEVDVTSDASIGNLIKDAVQSLGGIDILVTNAGGPPTGGFDQVSDDMWQHAFELNLLSVVRLVRETLPYMRKQQYGRILNISSISVRQPISNLILSNSIRSGVVGLLKTLAAEVAGDGILVHNLAPGRIATDRIVQLDKANAEKQGKSLEEIQKEQEKEIPLGRYGTPEEFAKVAVFLLSEANSYSTGDTVFVEGGALRSI